MSRSLTKTKGIGNYNEEIDNNKYYKKDYCWELREDLSLRIGRRLSLRKRQMNGRCM